MEAGRWVCAHVRTEQEGFGVQLQPCLVGGAWGVTWMSFSGQLERWAWGWFWQLGGLRGRVSPANLGPATCTASGEKPKLYQHGERQQQCLWLPETS